MTPKYFIIGCLFLLILGGIGYLCWPNQPISESAPPSRTLLYQPCQPIDTSGFLMAGMRIKPWKDPKSLEDIQKSFVDVGYRNIREIEANSVSGESVSEQEIKNFLIKTSLYLYEGNATKAYLTLQDLRKRLVGSDRLSERWLYTVIYFQGVVGLRRAENENCIECRGEGACIYPLGPSAIHTNPAGSRLAVKHFTEYLQQFPDDIGVRWLLSLARATLGEQADSSSNQFPLALDRFPAEISIGRFKDIAAQVGVARFNMAGGAIMDDFDNDGLLDIVVSTWDPFQSLAYYHNQGDGTFQDRTVAAGLDKQFAGFNLSQADYNNDGHLDIYISRGGWWPYPMRPTLLRNNGNGTFTDVTEAAGLLDPVNSLCAVWADFDNDGLLDLYVCNERGPNRLYRNRGDGTFQEVAFRAGVQGKEKQCKAAVWFDYDNDGYPDLLVTYLESGPQLFHNDRNGTFSNVTEALGIDGPRSGFSCWAFDYDNDGWLDLFITSYDRSLDDLVHSMLGQPIKKEMEVTRLFRNLGGKKFQDVSKETGVDKVFATMGCNFADFDNDGYLDFYLGTGDPFLQTIIPNRMFKNVAGKRFVEITSTSGTGHLQKGHGVACGDWDRDGNVDLLVQVGGATPGDRFHNALFQNPGQGNHWLTLKLVGVKTNRSALGARIKIVTGGDTPLTVHRHVTSGASFGCNPLQQTIGLGKATSIATLEILWPTSQTTQVFHDVPIDQALEVTEFAPSYRPLNWKPIALPR